MNHCLGLIQNQVLKLVLILMVVNLIHFVGAQQQNPIISHISSDTVVDLGGTIDLSCSVQYAHEYPVIWAKIDPDNPAVNQFFISRGSSLEVPGKCTSAGNPRQRIAIKILGCPGRSYAAVQLPVLTLTFFLQTTAILSAMMRQALRLHWKFLKSKKVMPACTSVKSSPQRHHVCLPMSTCRSAARRSSTTTPPPPGITPAAVCR